MTSEIAVAMAAVAVSAVGTMEEGVAKKDWIYNSIQHWVVLVLSKLSCLI